MSLGIEPLSTEVIHLIAAGEVIDSLAAVVRELAENALDAGATRITISVWANEWRVRVADNGAGMTLADLNQAAAAHSTSKLRDRQDLWNITSLGFRGEALHSLAQLSQLQIASRPSLALLGSTADCSYLAEAGQGWQATYSTQGLPIALEPIAIAIGTIVTADQLFAPIPARRQGLPPLAQQLRAVQATVHHLALCHPHVTWQVQQQDAQNGSSPARNWFNLFPGATALAILPQILRDLQAGDLREHRLECDRLSPQNDLSTANPLTTNPLTTNPLTAKVQSLYLLLGLPDRCHRHRPDWVRVAINGRFVQMPVLENTILAAFRRTLPRDRHPVCFVHLRVPPGEVDWNRHPAKSEIYLHHLDFWREQITTAIQQALQLHPASLPEPLYSSRIGTLIKAAEAAGSYNAGGKAEGEIGKEREAGEEGEERGEEFQIQKVGSAAPGALRAIAQVHNTYILAEHPAGICLIEQHIAHERVLYEQLCDRWQLVPITPPMILQPLLPSQVEQLQRIGMALEPFGEQAWIVRFVPELLADREDCQAAILELSLGGDLPAAQAATACRTAIRNGTPLSLLEMQTLLNQWQQTRNPHTCPHGRPICLTLEESSLSRFFRRHWMIGKSHGI